MASVRAQVIYDTLIRDIMEECSDKQGIFAVVGHEIGHRYYLLLASLF